jgi:hypothetical protein
LIDFAVLVGVHFPEKHFGVFVFLRENGVHTVANGLRKEKERRENGEGEKREEGGKRNREKARRVSE